MGPNNSNSSNPVLRGYSVMPHFSKHFAVLPAMLLGMSAVCHAETANLTAEDKKLLEGCLKCHSSISVAADPSIPQLAGQYPQYLFKQVNEFIEKKRAGHEKAALPKDLDEERWKRITLALSQITVNTPTKPKTGGVDTAIANGKNIFLNGDSSTGARQCVQCHGPEGRGRSENISIFPILANQNYNYIVAQLKRFRNSERTNDQAFMMRNVAGSLSDNEIESLASYLAYLPSAREVKQDKPTPPPKPQASRPEAKPEEIKKEVVATKESQDKPPATEVKKDITPPKPAEKPAPAVTAAIIKPPEIRTPPPAEPVKPAAAPVTGIESELNVSIRRGRDKAIVCEACHGPGGRSTSAVNPNLAGQHSAYLEKQMKAYRGKKRHDAVMTSIAESLTDQDIQDLAAYFANSKRK